MDTPAYRRRPEGGSALDCARHLNTHLTYLETATKAFLECALFADAPEDGVEFTPGQEFHRDDFHWDQWTTAAKVRAAMIVTAFVQAAGDLLDGLDPADVGRDLWFSSRGHGVGFWDRGLGDRGDKLTEIAKEFEFFGGVWAVTPEDPHPEVPEAVGLFDFE